MLMIFLGVVDIIAGALLLLNANSIGLGNFTTIIAAILIIKGFISLFGFK